MKLQVDWDTIPAHAPIIVADSDCQYIVFYDTAHGIQRLLTKSVWKEYMSHVSTPSKITSLSLRIDSHQTSVYYLHYAHWLENSDVIEHKQFSGGHRGLLWWSSRIMHAMHAAYEIKGGHLWQRKDVSFMVEFKDLEDNVPIVATKNRPGRYGVYLTTTDADTGKQTLPTCETWNKLLVGTYPTFHATQLLCSTGDLILVYLVDVDGYTETGASTQHLLASADPGVDALTKQIVSKLRQSRDMDR